MKAYVVGFLFNEKGAVWLIRKNKPEWQAGKFNGIGGKIEEGETPDDAMCREFKEEAGLDITDWKHFGTLSGNDYVVHCYYAYSEERATTMTDEPVAIFYSIPTNVIPNINWLVPMILSFKNGENLKKISATY